MFSIFSEHCIRTRDSFAGKDAADRIFHLLLLQAKTLKKKRKLFWKKGEVGSYKSSLGFYLTGNTYQGRNGYSLLLDGLEKGINDRARERAIVVHGAAYANPSVCKSGRLGRSFGCPALPQALTKPIINTIKGGSVLFIYANNKEYMAKSSILPNQTSQELFTEACESEQTVSAHL